MCNLSTLNLYPGNKIDSAMQQHNLQLTTDIIENGGLSLRDNCIVFVKYLTLSQYCNYGVLLEGKWGI